MRHDGLITGSETKTRVPVTAEIVGRDEELHLIGAFLDGTDEQGPDAVVLEGEAGIGKSTLWRAGIEAARERGMRVLAAQPAEAERGLAYAGLGDLLEGVMDDALPALEPPRRRALEVALLRDLGERVDPRALAVAVRDALDALCDREPTLLAVDDVQWLDSASSSAIAFALRRLPTTRLPVLLARRSGTAPEPSELERALPAERIRRLAVEPLSVGAVHRLVRDRVGRSFARQTLLRIHERSGGNPFFALELARALGPDVDPIAPLPVPDTLEALVRARLEGLPAASREALALASALGTASEALLERAGVTEEALDQAAAAQVIVREQDTVRFSHPLLASVLYADLASGERRRVHARIARIVADPLVRARHLALSTDGPDETVASALDEAVRTAGERGAAAVAAELAEHALRLTSPAEARERSRRALATARAEQAAGEWTRARTIAAELLEDGDIGEVRAEALMLLADFGSVDQACDLLAAALEEAKSRPALEAAIQVRLAWSTRFRKGAAGALPHAYAALELADQVGDDALRVEALAMVAYLGLVAGDVAAPRVAARALDVATATGNPLLVRVASMAVADALHHERRGSARELLERGYLEWRDRDELWGAEVLWVLSWVELWVGRWELAADYAARARDIRAQYGLEIPQTLLPVSLIALHRGQLDVARGLSERALILAGEQLGLHPPIHLAILGLIPLWSGDAAAAIERLAEADEQAAKLGWGEPTQRPWTADYAEALLELGRVDDAVRLVDRLEEDAARLGRDWVLAEVTRCRGFVAAARGELDEATALFEQAVERHEAVGDPFGRARALLALGGVRRRTLQKSAAREAIEAALAGFEELGAATWVKRARDELGRISGRTRVDGLTPAERRVAELVANGRTNREVAAALFLGERTVASHLTHIYAKLGVRSRTELARRLR